MDKNVFEKYMKAGKTLARIRNEALNKIIKPGAKILEITNFIETKIKGSGCGIAFPVNVSINEIAAHYTPVFNDAIEIKDGDLVKIDIGVQCDGYIADSAITYCSEKNPIIDCAEKAVNGAIKILKPGLPVYEIGKEIEKTVNNEGLGLIINLTGHMLDKDAFHAPPSIPNIDNKIDYILKEGDVLAIEPFIVQTNGYIREGGICEIYRYLQERPVRSNDARSLLNYIKTNYKSFPFAKRWLCEIFNPGKLQMILKQLEMAGAIERYPILKEVENKLVSQSEHTIIIKDRPIVTTKLDD